MPAPETIVQVVALSDDSLVILTSAGNIYHVTDPADGPPNPDGWSPVNINFAPAAFLYYVLREDGRPPQYFRIDQSSNAVGLWNGTKWVSAPYDAATIQSLAKQINKKALPKGAG